MITPTEVETALIQFLVWARANDDPFYDFLRTAFPEFSADNGADKKFPLSAGHATLTRPDNVADLLGVISSLPGGDLMHANLYSVSVTFELATSVSDKNTRAARAQAHSLRAAAIQALFCPGNIETILTDLNAPTDGTDDVRPWKGIGFNGCQPPDFPDVKFPDGQDNDTKQLIASPVFIFDVFNEATA